MTIYRAWGQPKCPKMYLGKQGLGLCYFNKPYVWSLDLSRDGGDGRGNKHKCLAIGFPLISCAGKWRLEALNKKKGVPILNNI